MLSAGTNPAALADGDNDAELVSRLTAFEPEAWQHVFDQYYKPLFRLAYVKTFDRNVAEDIAAETLAEAARGIGRYRYRGVPFRAWLFRIASNIVVDHIKARSRRPQVPLETVDSVLEMTAVDSDLRTDFLRALQDLTEEQRSVVVLRFVSDCSLAEVASVMNRSEGAIKQLQRRALATLKQSMSAYRQVRP